MTVLVEDKVDSSLPLPLLLAEPIAAEIVGTPLAYPDGVAKYNPVTQYAESLSGIGQWWMYYSRCSGICCCYSNGCDVSCRDGPFIDDET